VSESGGMTGVWNLTMMVLASIGSLAFGILAASVVLRIIFALMCAAAARGCEGSDESGVNSRQWSMLQGLQSKSPIS